MTSKWKVLLGTALVGVLVPMAAWAGFGVYLPSETIQLTAPGDGSFRAYGIPRVVRTSADTNQWIGCRVIGYLSGQAEAICSARGATGNAYYCYTNNPGAVAVANSIHPDYELTIASDASGRCTQVQMDRQSYYLPGS